MTLAAALAEALRSHFQPSLFLRFEQVENVLKAHAVSDQLVLKLPVLRAGFSRDVRILVHSQHSERLFNRFDLLGLEAKVLLIDDVLQFLRVFLHLYASICSI